MQHCKKQYYQVALPGGHLVVEGCWRVLCCSLYVSELFLPSLSKKKTSFPSSRFSLLFPHSRHPTHPGPTAVVCRVGQE